LLQHTISRNATDHHPGTVYNIFKISQFCSGRNLGAMPYVGLSLMANVL